MYPDSENNEKYYGYCESATGIGLMAGPIIGQVIYNKMGFSGCFYSTAFLMMVGGILSWYFIGEEVNAQVTEPENKGVIKIRDMFK